MAQHAILRFEKHKGNPARPLEAHHERQKEQYASNPDIDTSRSKYNFHIVSGGTLQPFLQNRIEQAGCRTRKDSTRFVDTLVTASPEFFQGEIPKGDTGVLPAGGRFPHWPGRTGKYRVGGGTHGRENSPTCIWTFVPLTKDTACALRRYRHRANLTKWQDDFHAYMVEKYPDLERGEECQQDRPEAYPHPAFQTGVSLSKQARAIEAALDGINPLNAERKKRKPSPC